MKLLIALVLFIALVAVWVVWGRPWLKTKPWPRAQGFFAWIEPIEIALWRKSETILWARLKMLVGVLLAVLTQIGSIDITPIMPLVPDQYESLFTTVFGLLPLVITLVGWIDEKLRRDTTMPIEMVALSDEEMKKPEVAEAIAVAQATKIEAVAVVKAEEVKTEIAAATPAKGSE